MNPLLQDLQARGLIAQTTDINELSKLLDNEKIALYCGFDPTADSLHIGHLLPVLVLRRFQNAGHTPVALVGGATGMIGDPSFKATERSLNTPETVAGWVESIKNQLTPFLKFDGENPAIMENNANWFGSMNCLDFLRDIGKHFSVNAMLAKESVKQRIEREDQGISFTEFSYALLQGYDFAQLNTRHKWKMGKRLTAQLDLFRRILWAVLMVLLVTGVWASWMNYEIFVAFIIQSASWVVLALAALFMLLAIWVPRPYCRFVCPTGTLFKQAQHLGK